MSVTATASRPAGFLARLASAFRGSQAALRVSPAAAAGPSAAAERSPAAERPTPAGAPPGGQFRHRHEDALAVLSATRGVLARGWVQNTWYVLETPAGRRPARQRFFPSRLDHQRVIGACLIGAVMHGAWQLSPRTEYAYPAIDALWHTLFEGDAGEDPVGPMTPPLVRAARVRDLTTWNDRDHRTSQDVLGLVDRAIARISHRHAAEAGRAGR